MGMARPELHGNKSTDRISLEESYNRSGKLVLPALVNTLRPDEDNFNQITSTPLSLLGAHCPDDPSKPEPEQSQQ